MISKPFQIFVLLLLISTVLFAQPRMNAEKRLELLKERLNLTAEQTTILTELLKKHENTARTLRDESQGDFQSMREKMMKINEELNQKILSLLDDKQKEEYKKIIEERKNFRGSGRRPGNESKRN